MSIALRSRTSPLTVRDLFPWDPAVLFERQTPRFTPTFEVKETPAAFILKADLPGVTEADLEINVHDHVLTVSGARKPDEAKDGEAYVLHERQFGPFSRSFKLAQLADGERIAATLDAGVLTLTIGKRAEAQPRKIAITK